MKGLWIAAACCLSLMQAPIAWADDQWTMGGQNLDNSRSQATTGIDRANVPSLALQWVFTTAGDVSATPAVINGIVFFPDYAGNFYAVNAQTGGLVWRQQVSAWTQVPGDYSRSDPVLVDNLVIIGDQAGQFATWDATNNKLNGAGARIIAANAWTGKLVWVSQIETFPGALVTSSPVVYNGIVYVGVSSSEEGLPLTAGYSCCVFRGSVVALDEQTGKKLWQTYMVPDNNGIPGGYSGGGVWSSTPVIDPKRNVVYVGTGNNYSVPASVSLCNKTAPNNDFCATVADYFDSVVALDLSTGAVRWASRAMTYDASNLSCASTPPGPGCPVPSGPDYDFAGSGPNLFTASGRDILGIGGKSGFYWALNPDNGAVIWRTQVGPGTDGIVWGTATDGAGVYVPIANQVGVSYALQPSQTPANGGSWAALDPASGTFLWQTATPSTCAAGNCMALGPPSVAGGVVFVGSMDVNPANPTMFALDASSGQVLWSFVAGSSVNAGPAIVGNWVYWGSGYRQFGPTYGTPNNKLFAFEIAR